MKFGASGYSTIFYFPVGSQHYYSLFPPEESLSPFLFP